MVSHDDGSFTIESLDPQLLFRVLAVAEGLEPAFLEQVDPSAGAVEVKLKRRNVPDDVGRILRGRVVDPFGNPVVGAVVEPFGCKNAQSRWWGRMPGVDPLAITNLEGEFLITTEQPAIGFDLRVSARGLATRIYALAPTGNKQHQLELTQGTIVTGRVLKDGKPVSGIAVGLVQADRSIVDSQLLRLGPSGRTRESELAGPEPTRGFVGPYQIATDERGEFLFRNVVADEEMYVYGIMTSLKEHGAFAAKKIRAGTNNTATDAGDLIIEIGHRLSGRVTLEDGKPIPAGTRMLVDRENAWDTQLAEVDANGQFTLEGLPSEIYGVTVRVPGYRMSEKNRSLDRMNGLSLKGLVDQDIQGIHILLTSGDPKPPNYSALSPKDRDDLARSNRELRNHRLQGIEP